MTEDALSRALRAWHGSPYDFEEFKNEAIGTGEGTRAMGGFGIRGHGHYVAEVRKVGEEYRDRLHHRVNAVSESVLFRGKHAGMVGDVLISYVNGLRRIEKEEKDLAKVTDPALRKEDQEYIKRLKETSDNLKSDINGLFPEFLKLDQPTQNVVVGMFSQTVDKEPLTSYTRYLQGLQDHPNYAIGTPKREILNKAHEFMLPHLKDFEAPSPPQGRLYELNLNLGEHELLDWDEILDNHHDKAAEKLASIPEIEDAYDGTQIGDATGEDLYKRLVMEHGTAVKASNRLLEHGIRGIRYKDQGSRDRSPILELDGNVMDHSARYWPTAAEARQDPEVWDRRTAQILATSAHGQFGEFGERGLQKAADWMAKQADQWFSNPGNDARDHEFEEYRDMAAWYEKNKHRIKFEPPKATYNYVIFDPTAIKIMRKLGMKGEVIKDFTDTGVHLKSTKGSPD